MTRFIRLLFLAVMLSVVEASFSQPTTAMDFTMNDCATGQVHNLYSILDSGNVVIMEFFMDNCSPCVDAGKALDSMYKELKLTCPNIRFFQTVFNNTDNCTDVNKWINTNGFYSSVPFDSGAAQISYYGFFGMPTVAVAAGNTHKLIYLLTTGGFNLSDTAIIADSIQNFCALNAIANYETNKYSLSVSPNPSPDGQFSIQSSKHTIGEIEIYDSHGKQIYSGILNSRSGKIRLRREKGIYFLKSASGNTFFSEKIIIQ